MKVAVSSSFARAFKNGPQARCVDYSHNCCAAQPNEPQNTPTNPVSTIYFHAMTVQHNSAELANMVYNRLVYVGRSYVVAILGLTPNGNAEPTNDLHHLGPIPLLCPLQLLASLFRCRKEQLFNHILTRTYVCIQ